MGDYNRSSRICSLNQLRPELAQAVRVYWQQHEMNDLELQVSLCCETTSEKKKKGFFASFGSSDPDPVHYTAALITPAWLFWARSGAKYGTAVMAARWRDIQVSKFASSLMSDSGLTVSGLFAGSAEQASAFIGLGEDAAGQQFAAAAHAAAQSANR